MNKKIFNTIKFRLVACFAGLIALSLITTLFLINYSLKTFPPPTAARLSERFQGIKANSPDTFVIFSKQLEEERLAVQNRVLMVSVVLIFTQIAVATIGGYYLIDKIIYPLEAINNLIKEINEKMLYTQIQFEETENVEEIKELITSFNEMIKRLNTAFSSQKKFVENVSHEIKTPLTVIKTNLESILHDSGMSKKEISSAVHTAINSINFLNNLTEDLLLLSLVDKKNVQTEQIDVFTQVKKIIDGLTPLAKENDIRLILESEGKELKVRANAVLFHRAVANVIENAIKYSPNGTNVTVSLKETHEQAQIKVSDSGKGIPEEFKEKIFDRFFRVDKSRSRETGGTGLGLAISREVIEFFHGIIFAKSSESGSIFTIRLPLVNTKKSAKIE